MYTPFFNVLQPLGDSTSRDGLRHEHNLALNGLGVQYIAGRDGELFPDASRDYHLILFLTVTMGIGVVAELPLMAV